MFKKSLLFLSIFTMILLAACSNSSSSADAGATAVPTLPPLAQPQVPVGEELINVSQTGPGSSDVFTISQTTKVRVNWQQASNSEFSLVIVNEDPSQMGTPYGKVVFESTVGPNAMLADYELIPGQYRIVVERADGPWKAWVELLGRGN